MLRHGLSVLLAVACLGATSAHAQDATWNLIPGSTDWNTAVNWTPSTVPTGTAKFGLSSITSLTFSADTSVGNLQFNGGAPTYSFDLSGFNWTIGGNNLDTLISGTISDSVTGGTLIKSGTGTLTLSANDTYSGVSTFNPFGLFFYNNGTTVTGGTLEIANVNALGSGAVTLSGGTLRSTVTGTIINSVLSDSNTTNTISAAAGQTLTLGPNAGNSFIQFSPGSVTRFGSPTDTGTVVVASDFNSVAADAQVVVVAGTLRDGNGVLGNALAFLQSTTVNAGATLDMNDQVPVIHNLQGSGTVLTGTSAATTLVLLNGDEITGNFSFHVFAGVIMGPGGVDIGTVAPGGGQTILTGANTYTGGTTIEGNTILQLGNGGTSGSILGNVVFLPPCGCGPPGVLVFDRSDTYTFAGSISGPGTVMQIGSGTTILTGASTYTGPTNVNAGILDVTGSLVSTVFVNSGGTLMGDGTIGGLNVTGGGTVVPGNNGIGTLTVNGNLTFQAGSMYIFGVSGSTAGQTTVTGTAALAGTAAAVFQGTTLQAGYVILSAAGGISGTFDSFITANLPSFMTASLVYTPTEVDLNLTSGLSRTAGLTQNQFAVAATLDASFNSGHGTLAGLLAVAPGQLPAALNALSGEGTSGTQETAFGAGDLFLTAMMEQGAFWRTGTGGAGAIYAPMGYAPEAAQAPVFKAMPVKAPPVPAEPVYRAWFAGFDGAWHLDGQADPGSATLNHSTAGGAAGLDYQVNRNLLVGVAAGGSLSSFSVPDRATSGTLDGAHIGTYGVGRWGPWYAAGALAFNGFDNKVTRTIGGVGPTETARANFNSDMLSGRFEVGYRQGFNGFAVTPFAAVQFAQLWQSGFSETSTTLAGAPGVLGLTYASQTVSSLPTFLGAQFDTRVVLANGTVWLPYVRLSWVHEFEPTRDVTASFITLPVTGFTVFGPSGARDAARIDLGSKLAITRNAVLFASFEGEFSARSQMYAGKGGFKFVW